MTDYIINAHEFIAVTNARILSPEEKVLLRANFLIVQKSKIVINEILIGSSALANMIREGKITQMESLIQTGTKQGMQTMDQHLTQLVNEKKITRRGAHEKAINKKLFEPME